MSEVQCNEIIQAAASERRVRRLRDLESYFSEACVRVMEGHGLTDEMVNDRGGKNVSLALCEAQFYDGLTDILDQWAGSIPVRSSAVF
jgi:hypothetical protein